MEHLDAQVGFAPYTVVPQLEQLLEEHLGARSKMLMPVAHQETFVRIFPWFALAFLPFHFGAVSLLLGATAVATLVGYFAWTSVWLPLATLVFDVIALPGLFARTRKGWAFFMYAQAASTVASLLDASLFGLVTSGLIFWVAFQVKRHYA